MGLRRTLPRTLVGGLLSGALLVIVGLTSHIGVDRDLSPPASGAAKHGMPATGCYGDTPAHDAFDHSEVALRGVARQTRPVPASDCVPAPRVHGADGYGAAPPGDFDGRSRGFGGWTAGQTHVLLQVFRR
ncbi:MAG TPA: hypothetical protein VFU43_09410 [Streptosporangiaceae bacterium]|nr:hypothetical protein [Streptosporangiaceae bacterium]